jgi:LacI family transcriptional regulator
MVLGMLRAVNEKGLRAPDDLAYIGFDRLETLNLIGMNCSSVDAHSIEVGELAMKRLIQRMENESLESKHMVLQTDIRLRGSEAKVK